MTNHDVRLMVLGRMAAILVHELRQPVTVIGMLADALRKTPDRADLIDRLDREVSRMFRVMQTVTSFARDSKPSLENITDVVRNIIASQMPDGPDEIRVDCVPGDLTTGRIVRSQIEQVILNLARNAVESTAGQTIRQITISIYRKDAWIEIRVRDNGPGVDPKLALFKPFATTKPNGLGIGLAFSKAIVEAHDGTIDLEQVQTRGACFLIRLPASDD